MNAKTNSTSKPEAQILSQIAEVINDVRDAWSLIRLSECASRHLADSLHNVATGDIAAASADALEIANRLIKASLVRIEGVEAAVEKQQASGRIG